MDLRKWFRAARKSWWIVIACVVVATGTGIVTTMATTKLYQSSVTFFVRTPAEQAGAAYQADQFAQKRVNSYVQLLRSQTLADEIIATTGLPMSNEAVRASITARGDVNTVLLTATATAPSADVAHRIATAISADFSGLVAEIETPPGAAAPAVSLIVTSQPTLNPDPVLPRPAVNIGIAALIGFLAGLALIWLREFLDTAVRTPEQIRTAVGDRAVLGSIPDSDGSFPPALVANSSRPSIGSEAFKTLRTNLRFVGSNKASKVILVSSSLPAEGKSSTACSTAISFAQAGLRVLLIDADLRLPTVATNLGLEGAVGLTDVLTGELPVDEAVQTWGRDGLTVLASGVVPPNPSELLGGQAMAALLVDLRTQFDVVIIDAPPLLLVTDAAVLSVLADGALVVVRHGSTKQAQVKRAVETLESVDATIFGFVLNRVPRKSVEGTYYSAYYDGVSATGPSRPEPSPKHRTAAPVPSAVGGSE